MILLQFRPSTRRMYTGRKWQPRYKHGLTGSTRSSGWRVCIYQGPLVVPQPATPFFFFSIGVFDGTPFLDWFQLAPESLYLFAPDFGTVNPFGRSDSNKAAFLGLAPESPGLGVSPHLLSPDRLLSPSQYSQL